MEYKYPYFLIAGATAMIIWSLNYWKAFSKGWLYLPIAKTNSIDKLKRLIIWLLVITGLMFLTYASMGPRKALKFSESSFEVNDILIVLDVSRSMLADDLRPNRLEVAKEKLRQFAALKPRDRIGIIIFSEKVFTLLPLTTDPGLVDKILADIKIGYLGSGTNIGDALGLAIARAEASETKNKVIILLTDGVNNVGKMNPMDAAEMAKKMNIKVYTIGLGTQGKGARLPIGRNGYQSIPGGSIDLKTLKDIANTTNGKMYFADSENSLQEILADIEELERTKIKANNQIVYDELYYQYLLIGSMFFIIGFGLRRFYLKEVA